MSALLSISNLHAGYGGMNILKGVNMDVEASQIAVIVGPNGAGKSTALKAVFGLLPVSEGSIHFCGGARLISRAVAGASSLNFSPGHQRWNLSCCKRKTLAIFPVSQCVISVHARLQRPWVRAFPPEIASRYLCQSRHAPRTTADAPDPEILVRSPG
jgi:energy-coupling factor transporter ATP-binding protein EcfA2